MSTEEGSKMFISYAGQCCTLFVQTKCKNLFLDFIITIPIIDGFLIFLYHNLSDFIYFQHFPPHPTSIRIHKLPARRSEMRFFKSITS